MKQLIDLLKTTSVIQIVNEKAVNITGISFDSRKTEQGHLFVATRGTLTDGHDYISAAIEKGAKAIICETLPSEQNKDICYIQVTDSSEELGKIASLWYENPSEKIILVGVTGTNGKTTTKELIATVLSKKYNVASTGGNYNNHIGVPLTILSIDKTVEIAVIEMGANHPGEIKHLAEIAKPV